MAETVRESWRIFLGFSATTLSYVSHPLCNTLKAIRQVEGVGPQSPAGTSTSMRFTSRNPRKLYLTR